MPNARCPACALENPDSYKACLRCGQALALEEGDSGVWRDGEILVLKNGSLLPDRCVRCNLPSRGSGFKGSFYWHPPALYLLAPFMLLLYAIIALIVRKHAAVFVGLCPEHVRQRQWSRGGSWALGLGGLVSLFVAIEYGAIFGWGGLVMLLAGAIWGSIGGRAIRAVEIDDNFARFKGASDAYLGLLPVWSSLSR